MTASIGPERDFNVLPSFITMRLAVDPVVDVQTTLPASQIRPLIHNRCRTGADGNAVPRMKLRRLGFDGCRPRARQNNIGVILGIAKGCISRDAGLKQFCGGACMSDQAHLVGGRSDGTAVEPAFFV